MADRSYPLVVARRQGLEDAVAPAFATWPTGRLAGSCSPATGDDNSRTGAWRNEVSTAESSVRQIAPDALSLTFVERQGRRQGPAGAIDPQFDGLGGQSKDSSRLLMAELIQRREDQGLFQPCRQVGDRPVQS